MYPPKNYPFEYESCHPPPSVPFITLSCRAATSFFSACSEKQQVDHLPARAEQAYMKEDALSCYACQFYVLCRQASGEFKKIRLLEKLLRNVSIFT
jgi:hypothetical protein